MRTLARGVARRRMKEDGRTIKYGYFARHWRDYLTKKKRKG